MCGIVGAVAKRSVKSILLEGLKRLEYRGYDSAGIAILNASAQIERGRTQGKVVELEKLLGTEQFDGQVGIAHTRWATHGEPSERNAHPHMSGEDIAIVHNGIIENYDVLREKLLAANYEISSDTDSEIIAHLIHQQSQQGLDLLSAVRATVAQLEGAFALGVIDSKDPNQLIAVRQGSPLVIGLGEGDERFIASDHLALLAVAKQFIYLEEGDMAVVSHNSVAIYDQQGLAQQRKVHEPDIHHDKADKGPFRHYMLKEIYDQTDAVAETLAGRLGKEHVLESAFGENASEVFDQVKAVQIIACGTSYHAGLVAKYWFEDIAGIPCQVEIASEFRYRKTIVQDGTLFIAISQSGETADTLAALRLAKEKNYLSSLAVCNVPGSSLVRESELLVMTRAGVEIGVASTKAFTTQLTALLLIVMTIGRRHDLSPEREATLVQQCQRLPKQIQQMLTFDQRIETLAQDFADKHHALFLGRGTQYPVALEGALKLKEISYIHAEAYPAGELKHGPLALVDKSMPVIAVAPNDELLEKLKSNLQEVRARGGKLYVFADGDANVSEDEGTSLVRLPTTDNILTPILFTIPLQLLAYHVAVLKGTDVDQPRNLAKSVTVE